MPISIVNTELVDKKIETIRNNLDKTHIVTDFDGTLTHYFDKQWKIRPSITSILRTEWVLGEDYKKAAQQLVEIYHPIEYDHTLSFETRAEKMQERWSQHHELLIKSGLKKSDLEHIVQVDMITQRGWTSRLLKIADELDIPVLIFSASGIWVDIIEMLLEHWKIDRSEIDIISNDIIRKEDGSIERFGEPIIHSFNKVESVIWDNPIYKPLQDKIGSRPHAIVIGDSAWDAAMVKDRDDRTVLRIGLCNEKVEERLEGYHKHFDIVITDDDTLESIIDMLFIP